MGASGCGRHTSEMDRTLRFIIRTCKCLGRKPLALHRFAMVDRPRVEDARFALPRWKPRDPIDVGGKLVYLCRADRRGTVYRMVREWMARDEEDLEGKEKNEDKRE